MHFPLGIPYPVIYIPAMELRFEMKSRKSSLLRGLSQVASSNTSLIVTGSMID
jgi:hypothetical protein